MAIRRVFSLETSAPCDTCPILKDSLCLPLPARQRNRLRRMARSRFVQQGQLIFKQGSEVTLFASILTGVVKLFRTLPGGVQQTVTLVYPPDFLGYTFEGTYQYSASAATEVELCIYPRGGFLSMLDKNRKLSLRIFEKTARELELAREWTIMLGSKSSYQQVAWLFAIFGQRARRDGSTALQFLLPLSRADIAAYFGLTLETVSRNITLLRQNNVIELPSAREVVVPDIERLLAEAGMCRPMIRSSSQISGSNCLRLASFSAEPVPDCSRQHAANGKRKK